MRKKLFIILSVLILTFFCNIQESYAASACTKDAVEELAKIVYKEFGSDFAKDPNDNMFVKLNVASVVVNNASRLNGSTWQEKIYKLSDGQYDRHSTYKDKSFEQVVEYKSYRGEMAYISALVLSGKYNLPKNMIGQASCKCLLGGDAIECIGVDSGLEAYDCEGEGWGQEWTHVQTVSGAFDAYFGYSINENGLSRVDVFGTPINDVSPKYYKSLANSLKKSDYSEYTTDNVCEKVSNITIGNNKGEDGKDNDKISINLDACTNPDVLKVIYFGLIILDIVKIIIPIALIILGIIDFSKSVITSDEKVQKKAATLFFKRLLYAALVFIVPWIVEVLTVTLGNLIGDEDTVNFTDCIENANSDKIAELEKQNNNNDTSNDSEYSCYQCNNNSNLLEWSILTPSKTCPAGWHKVNKTKDECTSNKYDYIIYVGDSRTVGMCNVVSLKNNENCTVAEGGMGYHWLKQESTKNKISSIIATHPNSYIVINMGTNSALTSSEGKDYAKLYNDFASEYPNSKIVAVSVTQVDSYKAKQNGMYYGVSINDNSVSTFNRGLKSNLNSSVRYCDVYSKMQNYNYTAPDGVHYSTDTYKFIYDEIQKCLK